MCACPNAFHCSLQFGDWTVEREMRGVGVNVLYKCGGKLVGERTRKPVADKTTLLGYVFLYTIGVQIV